MAAPGQSFEAARNHWAYQTITRPAPPKVKATQRVQSPIDAFLLARLEEKNLTFAPSADKRTLLRRVYYDLIGLPPTLEEIKPSNAYFRQNLQQVVDRLLASPRYGERWGRHWLDVALRRYEGPRACLRKDARVFAYTYRDYVIRAFNEDLPFVNSYGTRSRRTD
jgi:hypothetical protein